MNKFSNLITYARIKDLFVLGICVAFYFYLPQEKAQSLRGLISRYYGNNREFDFLVSILILYIISQFRFSNIFNNVSIFKNFLLFFFLSFIFIYTSSAEFSPIFAIKSVESGGVHYIFLFYILFIYLFDRFLLFKNSYYVSDQLRARADDIEQVADLEGESGAVSDLVSKSKYQVLVRTEKAAAIADAMANKMLILIILAIVATVLLVMFSGSIVRRDAGIETWYQKAIAYEQSTVKAMEEARLKYVELLSQQQQKKAGLKDVKLQVVKPFDESQTTQTKKQYEKGARLLKKQLTEQEAEISADIKGIEKSIEVVVKDMETLYAARTSVKDGISSYFQDHKNGVKSSEQEASGSFEILLTAGLTRFGVMALGIYLVSFLVQLYRYNRRMAAHYKAQSNAIIMSSSEMKEFEELRKQFYPDVDFKETARDQGQSMMQQLLDALAKLNPVRGGSASSKASD